MIDLHTHSSASDGALTPDELITHAAKNGLSVVALTDHDSVEGIPQAREAARREGITFVPGIEINIAWCRGEFHLLGLGIDETSQSIVKLVRELQQIRQGRNLKIIENIRAAGYDVKLSDLEEIAGGECIGRPHIAQLLVNLKIVRTRQQAFDKYIGNGMPWYVPHGGANLDEAIVAIREAGGIPVLAHPLSLFLSWNKLEPHLEDFHGRGVEGLEAWHPGARVVDCERLEKIARKLGFFVTAGSDYHGEAVRPDRKIGRTAGREKINDRFWTEELSRHISL